VVVRIAWLINAEAMPVLPKGNKSESDKIILLGYDANIYSCWVQKEANWNDVNINIVPSCQGR